MNALELSIPVIISILRYLVVAGFGYYIFYVWKKEKFLHRKIQQKFPEKKKISHEIKYSLLSGLIFGLVGTGVFIAQQYGYTRIYANISDYGWGYFWLSVVAQILIHDTWFYWTHRVMHHPKIFPVFHRVHHLSNNPSPWAAFSFHPLEAVVEVGFFPLTVFLLPLHIGSISIFMFFMIVMNVAGHLGFELFPKGFTKHKIFGWYNTSTHHNMHHRFVKCNYGIYFNFWDRVMGTNHAKYHEEYERVTSQEGKNFSSEISEKENILINT